MADMNLIGDSITAIGALGTASFGLVDATKAFGGGISLSGLGDIAAALKPLFPSTDRKDLSTPLTYGSIYSNLRANWINGTALADQKAIAKTLLKLRLNPDTSALLAAHTGVDAAVLAQIAVSINNGTALTQAQADVFGRFDLALTSLLDQAYQRADQRYRNSCKLLAGIFSVILAVVGGAIVSRSSLAAVHLDYWFTANMWLAALIGALATPLAPIAKDLTSAIAAGVNVAQKFTS
jgi:hypothetical protein